MARRFSLRNIVVMTGDTITHHALMGKAILHPWLIRRMTYIALFIGNNVEGTLTTGYDIVMTTTAATNGLRVIHDKYIPRTSSSVTGLATISRRNVTSIFSGGLQTIMTTDAIAGIDTRMIKLCRCPCSGGMTNIARLRGCDMVRPLSLCNDVIVTTIAAAQYFTMIDR